ncbi:MAG TPA: glutamyl-tRNA amidotransferase [Gammaproteobacteria bacterium]|nr:glutamyl-tRNA amidotransferase [Gammaproteobacteria bacterium]
MSSEIQAKIVDEVKSAMRAREKQRLGALRLISAEFKRVEVDERVELDDQRVLSILDKMTKQRKDSLSQYESAGRDDLVQQEQFELDVIGEFMPEQLDEAELTSLVDEAIASTGAESMKDMGKVMGVLKSKAQGRVDMSAVGALVKSKLG